jgi:hypothetical protein
MKMLQFVLSSPAWTKLFLLVYGSYSCNVTFGFLFLCWSFHVQLDMAAAVGSFPVREL